MRSYIVLGLSTISLAAVACQQKCCDTVPVVSSTYVHRYGVAVPGDFWQASGQHGQVMSSMADGVVITRTYCAGLLDGDTTYSYAHSSQVEKRVKYVQGSPVKEVVYFFDGTPRQETVYDSPLGMSTVSTWYLNGTPKSIEQMSDQRVINGDYYTINNHKDSSVENGQGTRLIRDDYGQLLSTDMVQDGMMATRMTYFPNGSPREQITYAGGQVHGEKRTYHPAGEPNSVEAWENGTQHGTTVLFQHGEKYAEVPYVNGEKHGVEVRYRDGSDVVQEATWDQGKLHGPTTTYVEDASKTDWYHKGSPVSESDFMLMRNRSIVR